MHEMTEGGGLWGGRLFAFAALGSTNTWALEHLAELRHGDVVWARCQTAGRGRFKREWRTPDDTCLTLSVLLRADDGTGLTANLGQIAALAVADMLAGVGLEAAVKWPNDVMVGDAKIAGILLERRSDAELVVLGIGVNVNMSPAQTESLRIGRPATAMASEAGRSFELDSVRAALLRRLAETVAAFRAEGPAFLLDRWYARDWLAGRRIEAHAADGVTRGRYIGLAPDGSIRILDKHGVEHAVWSADIERICDFGAT